MFAPSTVGRQELRSFHRRNTMAAVLAAVWVFVVPLLAVAVYLAIHDIARAIDSQAFCAGKTFPTPYHASVDDCLRMTGGRIGQSEFVKLGAAALLAWLAGAFWIVQSLRSTPALLRALDDEPSRVVWAYGKQLRRYSQVLAVRAVIIGLDDGSLHQLWVRNEEVVQSLLHDIGRLCPRATLGYTPDRWREFGRGPSLLRQP
jgi:hypothetical protein